MTVLAVYCLCKFPIQLLREIRTYIYHETPTSYLETYVGYPTTPLNYKACFLGQNECTSYLRYN